MPAARAFSGPLAQLAEQQTLNLRVLGSIPRRLTTSHVRTYCVFPRCSERVRMTRRSARTTLLPSLSLAESFLKARNYLRNWTARTAHAYRQGSCVCMGLFPNRSPRRRISMHGSWQCASEDSPPVDATCISGKGRIERPVPFSLEMRKVLYRWQTMPREHSSPLLFATRSGLPMNHRNAFRDVQRLCRHVALTVRA